MSTELDCVLSDIRRYAADHDIDADTVRLIFNSGIAPVSYARSGKMPALQNQGESS